MSCEILNTKIENIPIQSGNLAECSEAIYIHKKFCKNGNFEQSTLQFFTKIVDCGKVTSGSYQIHSHPSRPLNTTICAGTPNFEFFPWMCYFRQTYMPQPLGTFLAAKKKYIDTIVSDCE